MKLAKQPGWLTEYFKGVEGYWRYELVHESTSWAIVKRPGHSAWKERGARMWVPTSFLLIKKSERHFDGTFNCAPSERKLHEGRVSKKQLEAMKAQMAQAEATP